MLLMSITVIADETGAYKDEKENITIIINNRNLSKNEYNKIIEYVLTGEQVTTQNILYTLLGHSMGETTIGTKTTHCIYSSNPRCKEEKYSISIRLTNSLNMNTKHNLNSFQFLDNRQIKIWQYILLIHYIISNKIINILKQYVFFQKVLNKM